MSKKQLIETRDIAKTIDEAGQTPVAVPAWKSFKEIKIRALTASIVKEELLEESAARDAAVELIEAENSGKFLEKYANYPDDVFNGRGIENARVRRNLDKFGLNSAITAYIKDIRAKYPENAKPAYTDEEKEQREAAMNNRARIGSLVSEYLRCFCEEIVNDIAHVAIEAALRAKRKIVLVSHVFDANGFYLKPARFLNLFSELPSFVEARAKFADKDNRTMIAKIVLNYLGEFARNLSNRERYDLIRANVEQYLKSDKEDAEMSDALEASSSTSPDSASANDVDNASSSKKKKDARFSFYIKKMLSIVRDSDKRYDGMRFNHDLTPFIDAVLNEFIQLIAIRSIVYITTMEIQTVSTAIIRAIILGMMTEPKSLFERTMTVEKVGEKWESRVAVPNVITFVDNMYPLGPRVHHPRKVVNAAKVDTKTDTKVDTKTSPAQTKAQTKTAPVVTTKQVNRIKK